MNFILTATNYKPDDSKEIWLKPIQKYGSSAKQREYITIQYVIKATRHTQHGMRAADNYTLFSLL